MKKFFSTCLEYLGVIMIMAAAPFLVIAWLLYAIGVAVSEQNIKRVCVVTNELFQELKVALAEAENVELSDLEL